MKNNIFIVLILLNIIGFVVTIVDKHKAINHKWRIPEKRLFLIAILGGSIGTYLAMIIYRHKTKHWKFMIGIPTIIVFQAVLIFLIYILHTGTKFFLVTACAS